MIIDLLIFAASLFLVVWGATRATKYSARLAKGFKLSKYTIGFIVVAVISILPEAFISISAALDGVSSFGLGILFGSNIADLTLVFTIILFFAGRGIKVESKILKDRGVYPYLLLLPLVLGMDGYYSRLEGVALIIAGLIFFYVSLRNGVDGTVAVRKNDRLKNFLMLLFSMAALSVGSHYTVISAMDLAHVLKINPILIGMLIVGIGTTLPELFFSLKCIKKRDDSLAIGDILGTVLADATIVIGILALANPFEFSVKIIFITGVFMVVASFILFNFMRSGRILTKKEGSLLFIFWLVFILVEFIANR